MSSAFLSHSNQDKAWVRRLAQRLIEDGVVVWLDEAKLQIGDSLIAKIADGIERMEYVIAVISRSSVASNWVQKELSLAMTQEIQGRRVKVLPLLIQDCELPEPLRDKLYADFREETAFDEQYRKVLKALGIANAAAAPSRVPQAEHSELPKPVQGNAISVADVRIVGVDKELTVRDGEHHGLFHVHLELSPPPPEGWDEFFDEERSFPRHTMWRRAWVEGGRIIIKCALDELEKYHLRDLKRDVEATNRKYMEAMEQVARDADARRRRQEAEEREKDDYLDRLDFK